MQFIGAPVNVYKGRAALRRGVVASEDPTGIAVVLAPQAEEPLPMLSSSGSLVVPRRPQPERVFFSWDEVIEDDKSGPVRSIVLRDRHFDGSLPPAPANDPAGVGCVRST
ncbi:hypothetical protein SAMN02745121_00241 [Nannocystis exedens]|uniref:Uncharacterized protein n=1 Tax=Nannocystis exedens TaxID=54 RepID=A0A1I1SSR6_9BACT|nr:hypothetical protein [Nannocystis exedens]PCC75700.1 hypothetical protein NAEX_08813 [Nannocystis exedens]SFD49456.1 hypothetical protein SAMN02745121_00241 [Nannocystis exedens]